MALMLMNQWGLNGADLSVAEYIQTSAGTFHGNTATILVCVKCGHPGVLIKNKNKKPQKNYKADAARNSL